MFKLLITVAVLGAILLVGGLTIRNQSKINELEKAQHRGTLPWYAEMAKAKGQRDIEIAAPTVLYAVPQNLEEAKSYYNMVIATPVASKPYAGKWDVKTWHKFRLIEELSRPTLVCTTCTSSAEPPVELLPLAQNEFLVLQTGGEVEVDGIKIITKDAKFPAFHKGTEYLLFVSINDATKIGSIQMGPWGTFKVNVNRNLESIDQSLQHPVRDELRSQYADSVDRLRLKLKGRTRAVLE